MRIEQSNRFRKTHKKLKPNQQLAVHQAVLHIAKHPLEGKMKTGDLLGMRVYKFFMIGQQALLAYHLDENSKTITLIDIGSHENFYRDLKH